MKKLKTTFAVILALSASAPLFALKADSNTPTQMAQMTDVINFRVSVDKDVTHNYWRAVVFTQAKDATLGTANEEVNKTLQKALEILKKEDVKVETSNIYTQTITDKNQKTTWIVNGSLKLRASSDVALSKALTALKNLMAVEDVQSGISKKKLEALDDEMIKNALAKFEEKAAFITKTSHAKGYKIISLNITSPMSDDFARPYRLMAYANRGSETPVVGNQITAIRASIDAQIQLIK